MSGLTEGMFNLAGRAHDQVLAGGGTAAEAELAYNDALSAALSPKQVAAAATTIDHPAHYGGADNPYEAIKVIEAWSLGFCLGNAVKYISRAGKKAGATTLEDLRKARWYIDREISRQEQK